MGRVVRLSHAEEIPKSVRVFSISNTGRDSLASDWRTVYLFDGVHQNVFGLFAKFN